MTQVRSGVDAPAEHEGRGRVLQPRRGLPGSRAVVGGFLVALAAVGMFSAYTSATAKPTTNYVVAARDLAPGDRIDAAALQLVAIDLPEEQRSRSFDVVEPLLDATVVEPLVDGELVQQGSLVATGAVQGTRSVSFAIEAARAVNATLAGGERVDVLATFGTGGEACTHLIASGIPIVSVSQASGSLVGQQGGLTVTVQIADAQEAVAVSHAANAGAMTLVRATHADAEPADRYCTPTGSTASRGDGG